MPPEEPRDWKIALGLEIIRQGPAVVLLFAIAGAAVYSGPSAITAINNQSHSINALGEQLEGFGTRFEKTGAAISAGIDEQNRLLRSIKSETEKTRKDIVKELKEGGP